MATTLEEKVQHGGREKPADWVDVDANGKRHSFAHQFAIVDEVDNILIDEARTPLIISGAPEQAADLYAKFARLAPTMEAGKAPEGMDARAKKEFVADFDFEFDEKHKTVAVTERGVGKAEKFLGNDQIYKTKEGKWAAVLREIADRHERGQPVLVGTISVEVSELLSERLDKKGIAHTVLNAKPEHAEREGEIIAEAGQPGAVTIATNMAGRGVDIKLGGNPEHLTRLELAKLGLRPGDPDFDERFKKVLPVIEERVAAT